MYGHFLAEIRRRAVGFDVGGQRQPDDPAHSWIGNVNLGLPGEVWPTYKGNAMMALAQVNLTVLPFKPDSLADLDFLTVFISSEELPLDTPNGEGWLLRAYKNIDALVPLTQPSVPGFIKPFPLFQKVIEADYPAIEDCPVDLPIGLSEDDYLDHYEVQEGFKLGGWPMLLQGEIFYKEKLKGDGFPEFAFQIDSCSKAHWMWGDSGIGHFARVRTASGAFSDTWLLDWQCL